MHASVVCVIVIVVQLCASSAGAMSFVELSCPALAELIIDPNQYGSNFDLLLRNCTGSTFILMINQTSVATFTNVSLTVRNCTGVKFRMYTVDTINFRLVVEDSLQSTTSESTAVLFGNHFNISFLILRSNWHRGLKMGNLSVTNGLTFEARDSTAYTRTSNASNVCRFFDIDENSTVFNANISLVNVITSSTADQTIIVAVNEYSHLINSQVLITNATMTCDSITCLGIAVGVHSTVRYSNISILNMVLNQSLTAVTARPYKTSRIWAFFGCSLSDIVASSIAFRNISGQFIDQVIALKSAVISDRSNISVGGAIVSINHGSSIGFIAIVSTVIQSNSTLYFAKVNCSLIIAEDTPLVSEDGSALNPVIFGVSLTDHCAVEYSTIVVTQWTFFLFTANEQGYFFSLINSTLRSSDLSVALSDLTVAGTNSFGFAFANANTTAFRLLVMNSNFHGLSFTSKGRNNSFGSNRNNSNLLDYFLLAQSSQFLNATLQFQNATLLNTSKGLVLEKSTLEHPTVMLLQSRWALQLGHLVLVSVLSFGSATILIRSSTLLLNVDVDAGSESQSSSIFISGGTLERLSFSFSNSSLLVAQSVPSSLSSAFVITDTAVIGKFSFIVSNSTVQVIIASSVRVAFVAAMVFSGDQWGNITSTDSHIISVSSSTVTTTSKVLSAAILFSVASAVNFRVALRNTTIIATARGDHPPFDVPSAFAVMFTSSVGGTCLWLHSSVALDKVVVLLSSENGTSSETNAASTSSTGVVCFNSTRFEASEITINTSTVGVEHAVMMTAPLFSTSFVSSKFLIDKSNVTVRGHSALNCVCFFTNVNSTGSTFAIYDSSISVVASREESLKSALVALFVMNATRFDESVLAVSNSRIWLRETPSFNTSLAPPGILPVGTDLGIQGTLVAAVELGSKDRPVFSNGNILITGGEVVISVSDAATFMMLSFGIVRNTTIGVFQTSNVTFESGLGDFYHVAGLLFVQNSEFVDSTVAIVDCPSVRLLAKANSSISGVTCGSMLVLLYYGTTRSTTVLISNSTVLLDLHLNATGNVTASKRSVVNTLGAIVSLRSNVSGLTFNINGSSSLDVRCNECVATLCSVSDGKFEDSALIIDGGGTVNIVAAPSGNSTMDMNLNSGTSTTNVAAILVVRNAFIRGILQVGISGVDSRFWAKGVFATTVLLIDELFPTIDILVTVGDNASLGIIGYYAAVIFFLWNVSLASIELSMSSNSSFVVSTDDNFGPSFMASALFYNDSYVKLIRLTLSSSSLTFNASASNTSVPLNFSLSDSSSSSVETLGATAMLFVSLRSALAEIVVSVLDGSALIVESSAVATVFASAAKSLCSAQLSIGSQSSLVITSRGIGSVLLGFFEVANITVTVVERSALSIQADLFGAVFALLANSSGISLYADSSNVSVALWHSAPLLMPPTVAILMAAAKHTYVNNVSITIAASVVALRTTWNTTAVVGDISALTNRSAGVALPSIAALVVASFVALRSLEVSISNESLVRAHGLVAGVAVLSSVDMSDATEGMTFRVTDFSDIVLSCTGLVVGFGFVGGSISGVHIMLLQHSSFRLLLPAGGTMTNTAVILVVTLLDVSIDSFSDSSVTIATSSRALLNCSYGTMSFVLLQGEDLKKALLVRNLSVSIRDNSSVTLNAFSPRILIPNILSMFTSSPNIDALKEKILSAEFPFKAISIFATFNGLDASDIAIEINSSEIIVQGALAAIITADKCSMTGISLSLQRSVATLASGQGSSSLPFFNGGFGLRLDIGAVTMGMSLTGCDVNGLIQITVANSNLTLLLVRGFSTSIVYVNKARFLSPGRALTVAINNSTVDVVTQQVMLDSPLPFPVDFPIVVIAFFFSENAVGGGSPSPFPAIDVALVRSRVSLYGPSTPYSQVTHVGCTAAFGHSLRFAADNSSSMDGNPAQGLLPSSQLDNRASGLSVIIGIGYSNLSSLEIDARPSIAFVHGYAAINVTAVQCNGNFSVTAGAHTALFLATKNDTIAGDMTLLHIDQLQLTSNGSTALLAIKDANLPLDVTALQFFNTMGAATNIQFVISKLSSVSSLQNRRPPVTIQDVWMNSAQSLFVEQSHFDLDITPLKNESFGPLQVCPSGSGLVISLDGNVFHNFFTPLDQAQCPPHHPDTIHSYCNYVGGPRSRIWNKLRYAPASRSLAQLVAQYPYSPSSNTLCSYSGTESASDTATASSSISFSNATSGSSSLTLSPAASVSTSLTRSANETLTVSYILSVTTFLTQSIATVSPSFSRTVTATIKPPTATVSFYVAQRPCPAVGVTSQPSVLTDAAFVRGSVVMNLTLPPGHRWWNRPWSYNDERFFTMRVAGASQPQPLGFKRQLDSAEGIYQNVSWKFSGSPRYDTITLTFSRFAQYSLLMEETVEIVFSPKALQFRCVGSAGAVAQFKVTPDSPSTLISTSSAATDVSSFMSMGRFGIDSADTQLLMILAGTTCSTATQAASTGTFAAYLLSPFVNYGVEAMIYGNISIVLLIGILQQAAALIWFKLMFAKKVGTVEIDHDVKKAEKKRLKLLKKQESGKALDEKELAQLDKLEAKHVKFLETKGLDEHGKPKAKLTFLDYLFKSYARVQFPGFLYAAFLLMYEGIFLSVAKIVGVGQGGPLAPIAVVVAILFSIGCVFTFLRLLRLPKQLISDKYLNPMHGRSEAPIFKEYSDKEFFSYKAPRKWLYPQGRWGLQEQSGMFGKFYGSMRPKYRFATCYPTVMVVTIAALSVVPFSGTGCIIQFGLIAFVPFVAGLFVLQSQPHRVPMVSYLCAIIHFSACGISLCTSISTAMSSNVVLIAQLFLGIISSLVSALRTIFGVWLYYCENYKWKGVEFGFESLASVAMDMLIGNSTGALGESNSDEDSDEKTMLEVAPVDDSPPPPRSVTVLHGLITQCNTQTAAYWRQILAMEMLGTPMDAVDRVARLDKLLRTAVHLREHDELIRELRRTKAYIPHWVDDRDL